MDIPVYVVSSWTNPIHTRSTQKAFQQLAGERKWLRIHNTMEWVDIAAPASIDDLRRFFDHYLKDDDNGWETTPRVRYAVLDPGGEDQVDRTADSWPPTPITPTTLYLDAATGRLTGDKPAAESSVSYDSTDPAAAATFRYTAEQESELLGPVNLRLWVETSEGNDLDLFAALYKLDADGGLLYHVTCPGLVELAATLEKEGRLSAAIGYTGPIGRLRASHRALDTDMSTTLEPYVSHEREEPVEPGTPIQIELGLWPTGMLIHPGQTLVLEIAGHFAGPLTPPQLGPGHAALPTRNAGIHTIRTGGQLDSCAFLPIVT
ncbi:hypothetical protein GCM10022419_120100 [Nonomuraea rosea]|uniref:Xaa-Pro dipeptidyl-peptidase C-terminal domain-containing protein n=1 Tax=Nonomuraea rosea TaxID=638574 RepID=A0ABP6ZS43_9ACTN